jgi:hypothetical protein
MHDKMRHVHHDVLVVSVLAVAAFALIFFVVSWTVRAFRDRTRRRTLRQRFVHAAEGEARAEGLLRRAGFAVLARQVAHRWTLRVDGEAVPVDLRADYLVARAARRFVAEVKTGRLATRIESSATRRQMLEYLCAFEVDGVLLVDADAGTIQAVEFDLPARASARRPAGAWSWRGVLVAVGTVLVVAYVTGAVR